MNKYIVYMHISPSNKRYIGITKQNPQKRWCNGKGYKQNIYFTNAINKYGWDNFEHIILFEGLSKEEAEIMEKCYIALYDTMNRERGYNRTEGGDGTCGHIVSEESRRRISEGKKGKQCGEDNHMSRSVVLLNTKEIFNTIRRGAEKYKVNSINITKCCKNEIRYSGCLKNEKLVWVYYEDYLKLTEKDIENKIYMVNKDRVICVNTNEIFLTMEEGAKKYNTTKANIQSCCVERRKSAGKHPITKERLVWMYYEDYLKMDKKEKRIKDNVSRGNKKRVICITTGKIFNTVKDGAEFYNIKSPSHISECCKDKRNYCGKLKNGTLLEWMYYEDYLKRSDNIYEN